MAKTRRRLSSLVIAVIVLSIMALIPSSALEPEELTSVTVTDRDGRVVTVGIEPGTDTWSALADGQNITIYTGLAPNENGMWYCVAGRVKFDYTGFVEFQNEQWYVENGRVATEFSGEKSDSQYVYTIDRGKLTDRRYTEEYSQKKLEAERKKNQDVISGALTFVGLLGVVFLIGKRKANKAQERRVEQDAERAEYARKTREEKEDRAEKVYRDEVEGEGLVYKRAKYLTDREKAFYPHLKAVADKLGYTVSMKPRLGDLVTGADNPYTTRGNKELFKVQRKHVDFALFDPETQEVKLIIELDDTTHDRQDRVNRDVFVDNVLRSTGYKILHVYDEKNLEKAILDELDREEEL